MAAQDGSTDRTGSPIRETYEEYEVGDTRISMIADPENQRAWIQSDTVREVCQ